MKNNTEGFTLIEVLIAIAVLSIGILAMQAMQGVSIEENTKSSNIGIKSTLASSRIEQILGLDYADPLLDDVDFDGTNQDPNWDGRDDDDDGDPNTINWNEDFGLRHWQCCPGNVDPRGNPVPGCLGLNPRIADHCAISGDFDIYWNVAPDHPVENTKTINIIVVEPRDQFEPNRMPVMRAEYTYVKADII